MLITFSIFKANVSKFYAPLNISKFYRFSCILDFTHGGVSLDGSAVRELRLHALDLDQHVVAFHPDRVFREAAVARVDAFPRAGFEGPLMGSAHQHLAVELSLAQRDVLVRAHA